MGLPRGRCVPCAVASALAFALAGDAPADADKSFAAWNVAPDDFVDYAVETRAPADGSANVRPARAPAPLAGFYGNELRDGRRVARVVAYEPMLYVPFVFRLPDSLDAGARTAIDETIPANWRLAAVRARGAVSVEGVLRTPAAQIVHVVGAVDLSPASNDAATNAESFRVIESGRVAWSADFDAARGLVVSADYRLDVKSAVASSDEPQAPSEVGAAAATYSIDATLTLDRVWNYRYASFQADVDRAIEKGCDDVEPLFMVRRPMDGFTALALLACVESGRRTGDEARAYAALLEWDAWSTYELSIALMTVDAWRTPPDELEALALGRAPKNVERRLTPPEQEFVKRCFARLMAGAAPEDARKGAATGDDGLLRWRYGATAAGPPGRDWDNSNSQYAVLGLAAAARCGVQVPTSTWVRVANHWLSTQQSAGTKRTDLRLAAPVRHDAPPRVGRADGATSAAVPEAFERGWTYSRTMAGVPARPPVFVAYGSMTCGGIASLAIVRKHLAARAWSGVPRGLADRVDVGVRDGFASLDGMFTVWDHPRYDGWQMYYLYALERAGILGGVERIGVHDWYWEGAVQLLGRLRRHGAMCGLDDDPWAVLFLKRAALHAAVTPR